MKKVLFVFALILVCSYNVFCTGIGYWSWRHDDGNEVIANYYDKNPGDMDTIVNTGEGNIRLRMEIWTIIDYSESTYLYYKLDDNVDTLWHIVSNDNNEAFIFSASENIINGEPTTKQLPNTDGDNYIDAPGFMIEKAGAFNFIISTGYRKELEFCIKATSNADFDNKRYIFSLNNADTNGFYYDGAVFPAIILQKPSAVSETETERLTIYPNPASSYINLKGQIPDGAMVEIYDLTGKAILKQPLTNSTINIRSLNIGNYIIKINDSVYRFTKQ